MSKDLQNYAESNKILEVRTGSHLYGTNTETSDEDFIGIFLPPEDYIIGLKSVKEVDLSIKSKGSDGRNTSEAIDKKFYEFRKFVNLALGNNPNILEILFADNINVLFTNSFGRDLLSRRHLFPCKQLSKKFTGYARAQRHKMVIKKDNFNELLEGYKLLQSMPDKMVLVEVVRHPSNKMMKDLTNICSGFKPIFEKRHQHIYVGDLAIEPGVYVKKVRNMLKDRLDKATNRSELILKYGFDSKFGAHLIRLLSEGLELLKTGGLEFPLKNKYELLDIRNGRWSLEEVIKYSEDLENELLDAVKTSKLPNNPDYKQVEKFVIKIMREHLKKEIRND